MFPAVLPRPPEKEKPAVIAAAKEDVSVPDNHPQVRTVSLVILATLATIVGLYFGSEFLVPIAFAVLLNALFRPVVRMMQRVRIPAPLGSAVVVLGLMAALFGLGWAISLPLKHWVTELPKNLSAAEAKMARLRKPVEQFGQVTARLEHFGQGPTPATAPSTAPSTNPTTEPGAPEPAPPSPTPPVASPAPPQGAAPLVQSPPVQSVQPAPAAPPGLATGALGTTSRIVLGITEVLLMLYLILACGGQFLHKLVDSLRRTEDKAKARDIVHEAEAVVMRYLLVTLMINLGQGALVTLVMWWLKMPTPLLWGAFTVVLEFIPYLGAAVMMVLLAMTAFVTFDGLGHIFLVPLSYLIITTLQNNVVSPYAYGSRLKLNPVAVLIAVAFWYFVWGIPGAFLAVPMVASMKILFDRIDGTKAIGTFLGE